MEASKIEGNSSLLVRENRIPASDFIDDLAFKYYSDERMLPHRLALNKPERRVSSDNFSYRILNHWEAKGLLEVERGDSGDGWRRFSFLDGVWLHLIGALRQFNYSIEGISIIHKQLRKHSLLFSDGAEFSKYPSLEFYTLLYRQFRQPIYLIVFSDHKVEVVTQQEINDADLFRTIGNHLRISIHDIINNMLPDAMLQPNFQINQQLTKSELELIKAVRSSDYSRIEVRMKSGEITMIEACKDAARQVHEILKEKEYDTLTIIREAGKVVSVVQKIKKKF